VTYTSYASINTLEDVSFIGGSSFFLDFNIFNEAGVPIDLSGKKLEWKLAPYGQKDYNSLIKTETPYVSGGITYGGGVTDVDSYTKRVTLEPIDTESLSGKYIQQAVVIETNVDLTTTTYKPAQGVITIISDIYRP
jgi:hypothetical protein